MNQPQFKFMVGLIHILYLVQYIYILAKVHGVARKIIPGIPQGFFKNYQPIRSSRLAGYRKHIYECLVSLYRIYLEPYRPNS